MNLDSLTRESSSSQRCNSPNLPVVAHLAALAKEDLILSRNARNLLQHLPSSLSSQDHLPSSLSSQDVIINAWKDEAPTSGTKEYKCISQAFSCSPVNQLDQFFISTDILSGPQIDRIARFQTCSTWGYTFLSILESKLLSKLLSNTKPYIRY